MLSGEPNENNGLNEDCGSYITSATNDTEMRGSQATQHSGLNDCPCQQNIHVGKNMPVVLCSRDPVSSSKSSTNPISNAQFNQQTTSYKSKSSTNPISNARFNQETTSYKSIFWAFVALVGWVLFLCAVAYNVAVHRQVSFSTPSWLRFCNGGARGSRVGPFSLNGLIKLITNRDCNELKATTSAPSIPEGVPNVSYSIGPVGEGTQAEHYAPPPVRVQLRQKEPDAIHENDYESANKYTGMHNNKEGQKANGKVGSYSYLVEENDDPKL